MKKVNVIILAVLVAALGLFTSCGEDVDPLGPKITLSGTNDRTISAGEELSLSFVVTAGDANLTDVVIKKDGGIVYKASDSTGVVDKTTMSIDFDYVLTSVGTYVFEIIASDKGNLTETTTVNVTVESPIAEYTAKLLYAPLANGTTACALATSTGATYTQAQAKENAAIVDILYFYGGTSLASFGCPADALSTAYTDLATWSVKNLTKFATSSVNFTELATPESLQTAYDNGTLATDGTGTDASARIYDLGANDVVAFKTAAGKYGVLKVVKVQGTYNNGDYIEINVKVQK